MNFLWRGCMTGRQSQIEMVHCQVATSPNFIFIPGRSEVFPPQVDHRPNVEFLDIVAQLIGIHLGRPICLTGGDWMEIPVFFHVPSIPDPHNSEEADQKGSEFYGLQRTSFHGCSFPGYSWLICKERFFTNPTCLQDNRSS